MNLHTHAATWRTEVNEPYAVAAMDQRVAARCALLREQGATVKSGRSSGAGGMLAVQAVWRNVSHDPRCDHSSPTYEALTDMLTAEGSLAAHMMGTTDLRPPTEVRYETTTIRERGPQWPGMLAGMAAGILAVVGLALHLDGETNHLPAQRAGENPSAITSVLPSTTVASAGVDVPASPEAPAVTPVPEHVSPPVVTAERPDPGPSAGVDTAPDAVQGPVEVEPSVSPAEAAERYVAEAGQGSGGVGGLLDAVGGLL